MVVVWSRAGAQFFHNLQIPAGFLQRAARVLFMTIVIAGGTGFLGSPLAEMYAEDGNEVRVLTRGLPSGESRHDPGTGVPGISRVGWTPDGGSGAWARALEGVDAVINLSGESLVSKRWSAQAKKEFRDSRILATRSLATAIKAAANPPALLISGSAVGIYGPSDDRALTERDAPGTDFLAKLCVEWEQEARQAERNGTRIVLLRTGVVLERSGGALPEMMRPFKLFAGGPLGSGRQFVSWIHRLDWIEIVRWIVQTPAVSGPVNATAPHPVTNRHLSRALGHAMHRPEPHTGAILRAEDRPRRVREYRAHRPARAAGMRRTARVSLSLSGDRAGVQGDLRGVDTGGCAEITGSQRRNGATESTQIAACLHRALRGEDALTTGIRSITTSGNMLLIPVVDASFYAGLRPACKQQRPNVSVPSFLRCEPVPSVHSASSDEVRPVLEIRPEDRGRVATEPVVDHARVD